MNVTSSVRIFKAGKFYYQRKPLASSVKNKSILFLDGYVRYFTEENDPRDFWYWKTSLKRVILWGLKEIRYLWPFHITGIPWFNEVFENFTKLLMSIQSSVC